MNLNNKWILESANEAIMRGDNEGFLAFCSDDIVWTFVGEQTLRGKEAVRQYMAKAYIDPPKFMVETLVSEGEYLTAIGTIFLKDEHGIPTDYTYCDVWRLRDGKLSELKAFVIRNKTINSNR
jgi:ketosteroid isomerase-like protein